VIFGTKGVELYRGPDGRVQGVKAVDRASGKTIDIKARRAVVLTAGNLEANPALMEKVTTPA
jgi:glycerol-3-phosphate dehydrogenase